jgi:hypothetical protein
MRSHQNRTAWWVLVTGVCVGMVIRVSGVQASLYGNCCLYVASERHTQTLIHHGGHQDTKNFWRVLQWANYAPESRPCIELWPGGEWHIKQDCGLVNSYCVNKWCPLVQAEVYHDEHQIGGPCHHVCDHFTK